jgi:hypothetical protein
MPAPPDIPTDIAAPAAAPNIIPPPADALLDIPLVIAPPPAAPNLIISPAPLVIMAPNPLPCSICTIEDPTAPGPYSSSNAVDFLIILDSYCS